MKLKLLFLVILQTSFVWSNNNNKILFLKHLLDNVATPGVLVNHLCWNKDTQIQLQNELGKINMRHVTQSAPNKQHDIYTRIFLADIECGSFDTLYKEAFDHGRFKYPNKWIIFGTISNFKNKNYYFPINSHIIIAENVPETNKINVKSLYKIRDDTDYFENPIGAWTGDRGFLYYNKLTIIKNRTNFVRKPLRVSYVFLVNSSMADAPENRNKHNDKLTKINYLLFEHLVNIWNMTHHILVSNDWGLEYHPVKKYHKGMLGDLVYGRADVSGTLSYTPKERFKYFKYLLCSIRGLSLSIVFRAPPLAYSTNLFVLPFDGKVWISCAVVLCICCLVIWIIMKWENREKTFSNYMEIYDENEAEFMDIVLMQIGVVCQMDYHHEPRSLAGKISTFSLLLGFSFIYNAFCAKIVILLQSTADNIHNLRDVYYANFEMGLENTPYNRYFLNNPEKRSDEFLRQLVISKIYSKGKDPNFFTGREGIKRVQNSFFAFHMEKSAAANLIEASFTNEQKCSVRWIETFYKEEIVHLATPKNTSYSEYISIGFHKMFETGINAREHTRSFSTLPKCSKSGIFVSVGLIECYFAFIIFIVGVSLSWMIFFVELIADYYLRPKKDKILRINKAH